MKHLKTVIFLFVTIILFSSAYSCKKCKNQDPRARIINNGTQKASVQIKTSGGNTENINNVDPGTSSEYRSYAPGEVTFTITVNNGNYPITVLMAECFEYDIAIDANNVIVSTPRDRNE